jgi:hypothetical protein
LIVFILLLLIFTILFRRGSFFKASNIHWLIFLILLLLKTSAGYLSYYYHNHYFAGGDSAIYLNSANDLISYSGNDPLTYFRLFFNMNRGIPEWEAVYSKIIYWDNVSTLSFINDNRNAIRINSIISLFSFNNILAHLLILNFLTITGLTAFFRAINKRFSNIPSPLLFVALFLSPSILFWTSGILKETNTVFILGLYIFFYEKSISNLNLKNGLLLFLLSVGLILVRSYFACIVLSVSFISLLINKLKITKVSYQILIFALGFFIFLSSLFLFNVDLFQLILEKQEAFISIGRSANSYFQIAVLEKPLDLITYFPQAMINVFIQPQLYSLDSFLYLFPIIENIDILFFCVLAIWFRKKPSKENRLVLISFILIYILSSWLIGITIPVQGAISRYKAISQLFLLIFVFSFIDWKRLLADYFSE